MDIPTTNEGSAALGANALTALGAGVGMLHGTTMAFVEDPEWREFHPTRTDLAPTTQVTREWAVADGDTVRLESAAGGMESILVRTRERDIGVVPLGRADTSLVAITEIRSAKVHRPSGKMGGRAIGYGAIAGFVAGAMYGGLSTQPGFLFFGGLLGVVAGSVVGIPVSFAPTTAWLDVDPAMRRIAR